MDALRQDAKSRAVDRGGFISHQEGFVTEPHRQSLEVTEACKKGKIEGVSFILYVIVQAYKIP